MKQLWHMFKPSDSQEFCSTTEDEQDCLTSAQAQVQQQLAVLQQFEQDCQERLAERWQTTRARLAISQEFDQPDVPVLQRQIVHIGLEYLHLLEQPTTGSLEQEIIDQRQYLCASAIDHLQVLQATLLKKQSQLAVSQEHGLADQSLLHTQIDTLQNSIGQLEIWLRKVERQ